MAKAAGAQIAVIGIDIGKNSFHVVGSQRSLPQSEARLLPGLSRGYGAAQTSCR